jgi:hypothetical protein
MTFGQPDVVKLVHPLLPLSNRSHHALVDLATKQGQPATFWAHLSWAWSYVAFLVNGHSW